MDITIDIHPERIRTLEELENILAKIKYVEQITSSNSGVALKQNNQFGASYMIVTERFAQSKMQSPSNGEMYVQFWSRPYFENLKNRLTQKVDNPVDFNPKYKE